MNRGAWKKKLGNLARNTAAYYLLVLIGFVFLYPVIYMVSYSFMSASDLVNPLVKWIPSSLYLENYREAMEVLDFWNTLVKTFLATIFPALLQTAVASVVGYGLSRFRFPGKGLILAMVLATFIIPAQVTMIPQFLMFRDLHIVGSVLSYLLPASLGQGIRSSLFILIFYQFFRMMPRSLDEAAQIDGANALTVFLKIGVPSALPAYVVSLLFSFVWYWNETTLAALYFGNEFKTMLLALENFTATYQRLYPIDPYSQTGKSINEAITMAGTLLSVLPLLVVYAVFQRWFVESVDRTGITGE